VLLYLHRRGVKKQKAEDKVDPHKSLDFGMMLDPSKKKGKRKTALFGGEKPGGSTTRPRQLSMDMDLSSPYLLPPALQSSRESLHSLARTLHQNEDPYRPVAQYAASDVASMRSFRKDTKDGSSLYTSSSGGRETGASSRAMTSTSTLVAPPRQNSLPKSPPPPIEPLPAHLGPNIPDVSVQAPTPAAAHVNDPFIPAQPTIPVIETVPYPDDGPNARALDKSAPLAEIPPAIPEKVARKGLPSSPKSREASPPVAPVTSERSLPEQSFPFHNESPQHPDAHVQPAFFDQSSKPNTISPQSQQASIHVASPSGEDFHNDQAHQRQQPHSAPIAEEPQEYYGDYYESNGRYDNYAEQRRHGHQRQSSEYPDDIGQAGLDLPQYDNKRLSVGFRPLPPDEMMDTEDPETRANRIRSFYKEYFDESKQDYRASRMMPQGYHQRDQSYPLPQQTYQPQQPQQGYDQYSGGHYYEDYDEQYVGEAAYYDPDSNAFVMPYAEPVARRAMTPPPSGSRYLSPRPGPRRQNNSSLGGMSLPGGRGGPRSGSRPGSAASSSRFGPRPGSSVSARYNGQRSGSAMSGRGRKPMPPPAALTTLPTPSKLKDDSFALMGAVDFAPPPTYADKAGGRSQSPLGERRAYNPKLPVSSPLVSSYDDMAVLPSP
jgi:hypothetical protein